MGSSKKYKLFSAENATAGEKPICAFFLSDQGCRNGRNCKFSHDTSSNSSPSAVEATKDTKGNGKDNSGGAGKKNNSKPSSTVEISENSSVVSSESEGEMSHHNNPVVVSTPSKNTPKNSSGEDIDMDDPFAPPNSKKNNANQGKDQQQRKKKRKSSDADPFAGPKNNKAAKINSSSTPNNNKDKEQQTPKSNKSKTAVTTKSVTATTPSFIQSFVSNLPIASFSIPDAKSTATTTTRVTKQKTQGSTTTPPSNSNNHATSSPENKKTTANSTSKKEMHPQQKGGILPTSTEVGRKWQKAIIKSRQHARYENSYDFKKYKEIDALAGLHTEWIKAKPYGPWCQSNPQAIAIDCEMCETQDPLSGAKNPKALCRISVVNAENPDEVLLDTLVKPSWPVTDYRTWINGVTKEHLDSCEFTLRHAQAFMMALCSEETVIVGHAVHNDLAAINMEHDVVADSSFLFTAKDAPEAAVSLKDAVMSILNEEMPETHDSVNDARKALACVSHWMERDGKVDLVERSKRHHHHTGNKLFVHRIPTMCKADHLKNMFLKHTDIQPTDVDEIQFSGQTGKTHVVFKSARHADLAFDTLDGTAEEEKSGRLQKKVYLRNGDYVRVRKMVHAKRPDGRRESSSPSGTRPVDDGAQ
jgi:RNA exonuclease 1